MTVIQLPEWKGWRIAGSSNDWQAQRLVDGKNGPTWHSTNYWTSLEYAISFAYEKTLRDSEVVVTSSDELVKECKRVKDALIRAVKKAVAE